MGFISSLARSIRGNKPSKRHSPPLSNRLDEDSTDLITKPCPTAPTSTSHTRDESIESASTAVQRSSDEEIQPVDSPTQRKQPSPADLNIQPLLDSGRVLDAATGRTMRPFTRPEHPVLKLDTTPSPSNTPQKKLEAPIDPGQGVECNNQMSRNRENSWEEDGGKDRVPKRSGSSRLKRSMTMLRKYSLKMPRSPLSMRNLRGSPAPDWFDACSLAEEACLIDEKEEKWLEAHGIRGGRDIGHWSGDAMGRAW